MSGLGVGKTHAINQYQHLVECASLNLDIGLYSIRTSLPKVYAFDVTQQFSGCLDWDISNILARYDGDIAAEGTRCDVEFSRFDFNTHHGFTGLGEGGFCVKKGAY